MCPQPPLDSIINPCLTAPVIGAYITAILAPLISSFLILTILRTSRKTTSHHLLILFILSTTVYLPLGGASVVLAGNPRLALSLYQTISLLASLLLCSFYWFVRAFLKIKEKLILVLSIVYISCMLALQVLIPSLLIEEVSWENVLGWYDFGVNDKTMWIFYLGFIFWIWSFWKLFQSYRKSRLVIERNRLKYLIVAPLIFMAGLLIISIPGPTRAFPSDGVGATIAVILLTYAVVRYKLLDISIVIRKSLLYSVLTIAITGIYLLFSLVLQFILQSPKAPISFPAIISTAFFVALVFQPLQANTQRFLDRLFSKRKYEPQELINSLSKAFSETLDLDILSTNFLKLLCQTIQVEKASLFLLDEETKSFEVQKTKDLPESFQSIAIEMDSPLVKLLSQSGEVKTRYQLKEQNIPLGDLDKFNLELFIPLRSREKLRGALVLGSKLSGELYSLEELNFLETIAHSAVLALDNAFLFAQLSEEKEKLEEARASLEVKVKARTEELQELANSLDEQVKQRTKELQDKVRELERFYRLTVGRELKMVELKKEIKSLRREIKNK